MGFAARPNEPYSGLSDVISSAQTHGRRHGRAYFEVEINQQLEGTSPEAIAIGKRLAAVVAPIAAAARTAENEQGAA